MSRFLKLVAIFGTTITLFLLGGCASIKMGDPARSAAIKKFEPIADVAQIYVCRNGAFAGSAIRPTIEIDNKVVATIATKTYAYVELKPGKHVIVAKSPEHSSVMEFTAVAGQSKYFQTWTVPGVFMGRAIIDEIRAEDGKGCVRNADLVEAAES